MSDSRKNSKDGSAAAGGLFSQAQEQKEKEKEIFFLADATDSKNVKINDELAKLKKTKTEIQDEYINIYPPKIEAQLSLIESALALQNGISKSKLDNAKLAFNAYVQGKDPDGKDFVTKILGAGISRTMDQARAIIDHADNRLKQSSPQPPTTTPKQSGGV